MRIGVIMSVQPDYGHGHRDSHRMFWTGPLRPPHQATFQNLRHDDSVVQPSTGRAGKVVEVRVNPAANATAMVRWRRDEEPEEVGVASLMRTSRLAGKVYQEQFSMSFGGANIMFATALNAQEFDGMDVTHIAMMHNDVVPEIGWLDILVDEMEATGADMLSVVLPIKDLNGLSSTGIDSADNPFCIERRITMTEVFRLPPTFSAADCGYSDRALLVNTGLFLLDFTKPWRHLMTPDGMLALNATSPDRIGRRGADRKKAINSPVVVNGRQATVTAVIDGTARIEFTDGCDPNVDDVPLSSLDGMIPREATTGRWEAQHSPADWYMSRFLHQAGAKVLATRKVRAVHIGDMPYQNMEPWGNWETDEALKYKWDGVPIGGHKHAITEQGERAVCTFAGAAAGATADSGVGRILVAGEAAKAGA